MKRSQINVAIRWAQELLDDHNIRLPRFAYWDMEEWRKNKNNIDTLRKVAQGWDVTDFATGDFKYVGAVLYTVRNGSVKEPGVGSPYAEKYILFEEGQELPLHYHVSKTEDIINRSGGLMSMRLYNKKPDGSVDYENDVTLYSDGIPMVVKAGEEVIITKGNSVRLTPYIYHSFGAKKGHGPLIAGEVSAVNDDHTDNYFAKPLSRYMQVEEDEPMLCPLCTEYDKL